MKTGILDLLIGFAIGFLAIVIVGGLYFYDLFRDRPGEVLNKQVFKHGLLEIQTIHKVEDGPTFDGQCVRVESRTPSSTTLQHVFESCGDLWEDFSSKDLHFLGDQKAYLTYGYHFAATVDAGKTWSVWDGWNVELCEQKKLMCFPNPEKLRIGQDGIGSMEVHAGNRPGTPEWSGTFLLDTRDFGQTWRLVSASK
jgi:hypothetical protein